MSARQLVRHRGTRTTRHDPRERQMESLAAEFALLAQRRARVAHQIDLLDHQREAAMRGFVQLQARMAWLAQRMDALDPDLRGIAPPPEAPPQIPAARTPPPKLAALLGRQRVAVRPTPPARPAAAKWRS